MDYRCEVRKRDLKYMWFKARLNVMFIIHVRDELKVLLPLGLGTEICKYVEFFFHGISYITCFWYVKLQHSV